MIQLPVIQGQLDRRILLNYRFDPRAIRGLVPPPFELRVHKGYGIGGVCMIRFRGLRPRFFPAVAGIDSENAAHRIAVVWRYDGKLEEGVYIPWRDTASAFNHWAGGKIFPGIFQRSIFKVVETPGRYHVTIAHPGEEPHVIFDGEDTMTHSSSSIFNSLGEASDFFAKGAVGYSVSKDQSHFEGMELRLLEWHISPLKINHAFVRLYEDGRTLPKGSAELDCAMVMQRLKHEWHNIPIIQA